MKTLGIVGGIGPESTIDYYRLLLERYRARSGRKNNPSILIDSIDLEEVLDMLNGKRLEELTVYFAAAVERLAAGGAQTVLFAANTAHLVFDGLRERAPVPLLSIVEATRAEAVRLGFRRLALLGTRFTMQARFYPDVFSAAGMELRTPDADEQSRIHDKYINELIPGVFLPETRAMIVQIIERLQREEAVDAVILAGTELPLLLREATGLGLPMLDTTSIHVDAAVEWLSA